MCLLRDAKYSCAVYIYTHTGAEYIESEGMGAASGTFQNNQFGDERANHSVNFQSEQFDQAKH